MRHQADDPGDGVDLGAAPPAHPRVELEVERNALWEPLVGNGQLEPCLSRLGDLVGWRRAEHEEPRIWERRAEKQRLADGRDAERRGAALERSAGRVGGSVTVAVRLASARCPGSRRGRR